MIISCENCSKKFDVESSLIPEKGRLLECNSCNHRWFYKNENITKIIEPIRNENLDIFDKIDLKKNKPPIIDTKTIIPEKKIIKNEKKKNFLNSTVVFIISFIAFVILLDTFKSPIGKIVPNIEFLLHNLYDSIKDILLFTKDLI
jgi:predicted Zn finger-like uncharacterized protein